MMDEQNDSLNNQEDHNIKMEEKFWILTCISFFATCSTNFDF